MHRQGWQGKAAVVLGLLLVTAVMAGGCGAESRVVGLESGSGPTPSLPVEAADASSQEASTGGACASNACPDGRVSCPNAPFPCGVDLSSDNDNCGACGVRCPTDNNFLARFSGVMRCVAGSCLLACDEEHADCNGIPDDGCETLVAGPSANDINNCGACGNVCTDICSQGVCGCPPGMTFCPGDGQCHNLNQEDDNCGACGNVCPLDTEPPFPPEWNVFRGCVAGQCNKPRCQPFVRDCNGTFVDPGADGCETSTFFDVNNCGECGKACAPGENCVFGECRCPCGAVCTKGLDSDPNNCGTCGVRCPGDWRSVEFSAPVSLDPAHGKPICDQGVCGYTCSPHWADCDGDIRNGCETDLRNDPLNCGGCGVQCDGIEGQPCIDGRCLTKECEVQ
ncbi:MAG: hypothetical protein BGO98_27870 [Myxococcales bacterium 68-20]|nr:hypothetical protein [Myxococcales bacterium]OJY30530.1 MAG: hypothetical protein BGO98_27870 [Myxococcales bacterium 68-20]